MRMPKPRAARAEGIVESPERDRAVMRMPRPRATRAEGIVEFPLNEIVP